MFDAANIEHAKKLAASLWAVDISVTTIEAAPVQRMILKAHTTSGERVTMDMVAEAAKGVTIRDGVKVKTATGIELEVDESVAPEVIRMVQLSWVAKFGAHRFGDSLIIPAAQEREGMRALSVNMVRTMLALVVNGTIGPANLEHGTN